MTYTCVHKDKHIDQRDDEHELGNGIGDGKRGDEDEDKNDDAGGNDDDDDKSLVKIRATT